MAQPSTQSVAAAYELLVKAQIESAQAAGKFGERIQNQLNDIGKSAIAYEQAQKDNEFRDKAHSDDVALKKEGLAIDKQNANTQARNTQLRAEETAFHRAMAKQGAAVINAPSGEKTKDGKDITLGEKLVRDTVESNNFYTGAPIPSTPYWIHHP